MPINTVNRAMAKLERSSETLRPYRSATRPQTGEAKAATNEVAPVMMPDHQNTPVSEVTPSWGSISGMIGVRKLMAPVMTS